MKVLITESLEELRIWDKLHLVLEDGLEDLTKKLNLRFEEVDVDLEPTSLLDGAGKPMTELEASRRLFSKLKFNSTVQSTDERVWLTLALGPFSDYSRLRWPTPTGASSEETAKHVRNHWFCHTPRMRFRDHPLSSLWWKQRYLRNIDPTSIDKAESVLFGINSDLPVQFLGRPNLASIPSVSGALIELFHKRYVEDGRAYERGLVRELLKLMDISAGTTIAPLISPDDAGTLVRQSLTLATASLEDS